MRSPLDKPVEKSVYCRIEQQFVGRIPGSSRDLGIQPRIEHLIEGCGDGSFNLNFNGLRRFHRLSPFFLFLKILLKLIKVFVPEPLVLMHPARNLAKRFTSKRYEDFATLFLAFNESSYFEPLKMFRHRV